MLRIPLCWLTAGSSRAPLWPVELNSLRKCWVGEKQRALGGVEQGHASLGSFHARWNWPAGKSRETLCVGARKQPSCVWWPSLSVCDREKTQSLQNERMSQETDNKWKCFSACPHLRSWLLFRLVGTSIKWQLHWWHTNGTWKTARCF